MRTLAAVALVGAALAGACHLKAGNEQTVTGTISGALFRAKQAYSTQGTSSPGVPPVRTWTIAFFVTDTDEECAASPAPGGTTIEVTLTRENAPLSSGTYGADGGTTDGVRVTALLQRVDGAGSLDDVEVATDGSVVINVIEPDEVRGTLSLTFPNGSVSGTFVAPFCNGDAGHVDAGHMDAEHVDAGHVDAGNVDAGLDAGTVDAGNDRTAVDSGPIDACGVRPGDSSVSCEP
jgi:hypothetical protein